MPRGAADAAVAGGSVATGNASKIAVIEEYADAACAKPPPLGNPIETAIWLGQLGGEIVALAGPPPATP
jgi:hypothetical protein